MFQGCGPDHGAGPNRETDMVSATLTPPPPPRGPQKRFTVEEYHRLIDLGILREDERLELIHGFIVEKPPIKPPHATTVRKLTRLLIGLVGDAAVVQTQLPITLSDSEPVPDLAIVASPEERYESAHPGPRDVLLAIEVSDSSLPDDQTTKLQLYAVEKIARYWIVNLIDRRAEVYTQPRGGKNPTYRARQDYGPNDKVPVTLAGRTVGSIPVREILPR
jgi:Uma2 family endonuclease